MQNFPYAECLKSIIGSEYQRYVIDLLEILQRHRTGVQRVINYGCAIKPIDAFQPLFRHGNEALLLQWSLEPLETVVVEIDEQKIEILQSSLQVLAKRQSCALAQVERITPLAWDMTQYAPVLATKSFDFAYSDRVLVNLCPKGTPLQELEDAMALAIAQIARVLKPGAIFCLLNGISTEIA